MLAPIVLDIETVNAEGVADFRWWRPGFRILSLALAWKDGASVRTWFTMDPVKIDAAILRLAEQNRRLVVHNLAFEMGVFETLYPSLRFNWYSDTMRLAQLHDNGGDWRDLVFNQDELDEDASPDLGLSLEAAASRVLQRDLHHHKEERDEYLRSIGIKTNFGGSIHLLPEPILSRYNIADTVVCLELFDALQSFLDGVWQKDWPLYFSRAKLMTYAYRRGISIDTCRLKSVISTIDNEISVIEQEFRDTMQESIGKWAILQKKDPSEFNLGSNKQLKELFVTVLGMRGSHLTTKGQKVVKKKQLSMDEALDKYPSFQSKHLGDWGKAGLPLQARRKRLLVLSQAVSALFMAEQGRGRVHPEQRVSGTRTNRVSGGRDE